MTEFDSSTQIVCCSCDESKVLDLFPKMPKCKYGRNTKCKACIAEYLRQYRQKNKDLLAKKASDRYAASIEANREERRLHYQQNKEAYKARAKKWSEENRERRREIAKGYIERNPELRYEQQRAQREKNPGYYRAHFKMRQQRKKNAIPGWADLEAIEAIYRQCQFVSRMTGVKHHVDHYFPLTSDVVCGLHVSENLRIIPATENLSKGNKLPE